MRRSGLAFLSVVVLVACGQPSRPAAGASPGATATPAVTVTPAPSSTPTPVGPLPTPTQLASVFGTCRLPVMVLAGDGQAPGGWLDVPAGTYRADPASTPAWSLGRQAASQSIDDLAWDPAVGKWVPAPPRLISPDGTTYVSGNLEVVDAATGAILHRLSTTSFPGLVVAYTRSTIYMEATGKDPHPGLWKVETDSWKVTQISTADADWELVDAGSAWGVYGGFAVRRIDFSTGKVTELYHADPTRGDEVVLVGFVGSGVLVLTRYHGGSGTEVRSMVVLRADGSVAPIGLPPGVLQYATLGTGVQSGSAFVFPVVYPLEPFGPPAALHGWGLAAWDSDHGLQLMMTNAPEGMGVVGPCMAP